MFLQKPFFRSACRELTVWITLAAFLLTTVGQSAAQAFQPVPLRASFPLISPDKASITDSLCFGSDTAVLLIQDLHCHPGVQKNIAALLKDLDQTAGLERIFVEGNVGPVDNSWITPFPENRRQDIIETLLNSGRLTGAEYFSLTGTRADPLAGLEDAPLLKPNIARLAAILRRRGETRDSLKNARRTVAVLKSRWYSPANKRLDRLMDKHEQGKIDSRKFSRAVTAMARKAAVDMYRYENLKSQADLSKKASSFSSRAISKELNAYLGSLKKNLSYKDWQALQQRTGNLADTGSLFTALSQLPPRDPLYTSPLYARLAGYLKVFRISESVNPLASVGELRGLIRELQRLHAVTTTEKEIAFIDDYARCLADYAGAEVTYGDYRFILDNREMFEFLWGKYADPAVISSARSWLPELDEFYRVNVARNDAFLKTIGASRLAPGTEYRTDAPAQWIPAAKRRVAVIAGGFHTEELARILAEKRVSYAVLTPRVPENAWDARERFEQILLENTSRAAITETYAEILKTAGTGAVCRDIAEGALREAGNRPGTAIEREITERLKKILGRNSLEGISFTYAGTSGNELIFHYTDSNATVSFLLDPETGSVRGRDGRVDPSAKSGAPGSSLRRFAITILAAVIPALVITLLTHVTGLPPSLDIISGIPFMALMVQGGDDIETFARELLRDSEAVFKKLVLQLSDGEAEQRRKAVLSLELLASAKPEKRAAVAVRLYAALDDQSPDVRLAAVDALRHLIDKTEGLRFLKDLWSPVQEIRENAVEKLGAMGCRFALASLRDITNSDDEPPSMRSKAEAAITAIERTKPEHDDGQREPAVQQEKPATEVIIDPDLTDPAGELERARREAYADPEIGAILNGEEHRGGLPAAPRLWKLLGEDQPLPRIVSIASALYILEQPNPSKFVSHARLLTNGNVAVQVEAVRNAGMLGTYPVSAAILRSVMKNAAAPRVRAEAAVALADREWRNRAQEAAGRELTDAEAGEIKWKKELIYYAGFLLERGFTDPELRKGSIIALGDSNDPLAMEVLLAAWLDPAFYSCREILRGQIINLAHSRNADGKEMIESVRRARNLAFNISERDMISELLREIDPDEGPAAAAAPEDAGDDRKEAPKTSDETAIEEIRRWDVLIPGRIEKARKILRDMAADNQSLRIRALAGLALLRLDSPEDDEIKRSYYNLDVGGRLLLDAGAETDDRLEAIWLIEEELDNRPGLAGLMIETMMAALADKDPEISPFAGIVLRIILSMDPAAVEERVKRVMNSPEREAMTGPLTEALGRNFMARFLPDPDRIGISDAGVFDNEKEVHAVISQAFEEKRAREQPRITVTVNSRHREFRVIRLAPPKGTDPKRYCLWEGRGSDGTYRRQLAHAGIAHGVIYATRDADDNIIFHEAVELALWQAFAFELWWKDVLRRFPKQALESQYGRDSAKEPAGWSTLDTDQRAAARSLVRQWQEKNRDTALLLADSFHRQAEKMYPARDERETMNAIARFTNIGDIAADALSPDTGSPVQTFYLGANRTAWEKNGRFEVYIDPEPDSASLKVKRIIPSLLLVLAFASVALRFVIGGPLVFDLSQIVPGSITIALGAGLFVGKVRNIYDHTDIPAFLNDLKNLMQISNAPPESKLRQRDMIHALIAFMGSGKLSANDLEKAKAVFSVTFKSDDIVTEKQAKFMRQALGSRNNTYIGKCVSDLESSDPDTRKKAVLELGFSGLLEERLLKPLRKDPSLDVRVHAWAAEQLMKKNVKGKDSEITESMEMALALLSPNSFIRDQAARKFCEMIRELPGQNVRKQSIDVLIYCLMDRDQGNQDTALEGLDMISDEQLRSALEAALNDENPRVRIAALRAMQEQRAMALKRDAALQAIKALLKENPENDRALQKIKELQDNGSRRDGVLLSIQKMIENGKEPKEWDKTLQAIDKFTERAMKRDAGLMAESDGLLFLARDFLPDAGHDVREHDKAADDVMAAACRCLGAFHDVESAQRIINLVNHAPNRVRSAAIEALELMGVDLRDNLPEAREALTKALYDTRNYIVWGRAAQALAKLEERPSLITRLLARLCSGDRQESIDALHELGEMDYSLTRLHLISFLSNPNRYLRAETIFVLGKYARAGSREAGNEEIVSILKQTLEEDVDAKTRANAAYALGRTGLTDDPALASVLSEHLKDLDSGVRKTAALALGFLKADGYIDDIALLLDDEDSYVRKNAAGALREMRNENAVQPLKDRLFREDDQVCRQSIIEALLSLDPRGTLPLLLAMMDEIENSLFSLEDRNYAQRAMLCRAMGQTRDDDALPFLTTYLRSGHPLMREAAAEAMGTLGIPEAIPALWWSIDDENPYVREKVTASLEQLGESREKIEKSSFKARPGREQWQSLQLLGLRRILSGALTAEAAIRAVRQIFPEARPSSLSRLAPALSRSRAAIVSLRYDKAVEREAMDMAMIGVDTVYYAPLPSDIDRDTLEKLNVNDDSVPGNRYVGLEIPAFKVNVNMNVYGRVCRTFNGRPYWIIYYSPEKEGYMDITARCAAPAAIAEWLRERPEVCQRIEMNTGTAEMDIMRICGLSTNMIKSLDTTSLREQLPGRALLALDHQGTSGAPPDADPSLPVEIRRFFDIIIDTPHFTRNIGMLDHALKKKSQDDVTGSDPVFSTKIDLNRFEDGLKRLASGPFISMLAELHVDTVVLSSCESANPHELAETIEKLHEGKLRVTLEYRYSPGSTGNAAAEVRKELNPPGARFDGIIIDLTDLDLNSPLDAAMRGFMLSLKEIRDVVRQNDQDSRGFAGVILPREEIPPTMTGGRNSLYSVRRAYVLNTLGFRNVIRFTADNIPDRVPPDTCLDLSIQHDRNRRFKFERPGVQFQPHVKTLEKMFPMESATSFCVDYQILEWGSQFYGDVLRKKSFAEFIEAGLAVAMKRFKRISARNFEGGYDDSEGAARALDRNTLEAAYAFLQAYKHDEGVPLYEECVRLFQQMPHVLHGPSHKAMPANGDERNEFIDYQAGYLYGLLGQYLARRVDGAERPFLDPRHRHINESLLSDQYIAMEGYLGGDTLSEVVHHLEGLQDEIEPEYDETPFGGESDDESELYDERTAADILMDKMKALDAQLRNGGARIMDVYPEINEVIREMAALISRHPAGAMPHSTAFLLKFMHLYAYRDERYLFDDLEKAGSQALPEAVKALTAAA